MERYKVFALRGMGWENIIWVQGSFRLLKTNGSWFEASLTAYDTRGVGLAKIPNTYSQTVEGEIRVFGTIKDC